MASGDTWEREVRLGAELNLDSSGCGCESQLCHLPAVRCPSYSTSLCPFPQVQSGAEFPLRAQGSEMIPTDVTGAKTSPLGQHQSPQTHTGLGCLRPTVPERFSFRGGGPGY